jgi:hypothetical protein
MDSDSIGRLSMHAAAELERRRREAAAELEEAVANMRFEFTPGFEAILVNGVAYQLPPDVVALGRSVAGLPPLTEDELKESSRRAVIESWHPINEVMPLYDDCARQLAEALS